MVVAEDEVGDKWVRELQIHLKFTKRFSAFICIR